MYSIKELSGVPRVYPLSDGNSFRLLPYEEKPIDEKIVTHIMEHDEESGLIIISEVSKPSTIIVEPTQTDEEGGSN